MKKSRFLAIGLGLMTAGVLSSAPAVWAWGPERPTYTNGATADRPVFNSITDNAAVGDERDFVRIAEKKPGATYVSDLEIEAGKQYEVYIYYHNDASETYNDKAHNYAGVARDVRLSSGFPQELEANERGKVVGIITGSNTEPRQVWDEAYITAKESMTLHYVTGSAKIYNGFAVNGSVLPDTLFTDTGTFIGLNSLNGVILGCDRYSGQIVYTIQTWPTEEKPDPEKPDDPVVPPTEPEKPSNPETPSDPETPTELPNTGPAEIVLAIVVMLAIVAGAVYWWKTHKNVRKVTKHARGRK